MRKTVKLVLISLSACFLSGCVSWFYTPGMSDLRELCEKDGGVQIYEKVEVAGYFDGSQHGCWGCWDTITLDGFQHFELEIKGSDGLDIFNHDQGYWRLEKVDRDGGRCHAGIDKMLMRQKGNTAMQSFIKDYCIKAEKVEKPKSQYGAYGQRQEWVVSDYYGSTITRAEGTVKDLNDNHVIAVRVSYLLNPWPRGFDYGKVFDCVDIGVVDSQQPQSLQQIFKKK